MLREFKKIGKTFLFYLWDAKQAGSSIPLAKANNISMNVP